MTEMRSRTLILNFCQWHDDANTLAANTLKQTCRCIEYKSALRSINIWFQFTLPRKNLKALFNWIFHSAFILSFVYYIYYRLWHQINTSDHFKHYRKIKMLVCVCVCRVVFNICTVSMNINYILLNLLLSSSFCVETQNICHENMKTVYRKEWKQHRCRYAVAKGLLAVGITFLTTVL